MNERIRFLAEKAGFIFWGSEDWKPEGAVIDWSVDYSKEFDKFVELLTNDCIELCNRGTTTQTTFESVHSQTSDVATSLKLRFGVK